MAETLCSRLEDWVQWSHWYRLAEKIDEVAANLGVPDYEPLTEDEDTPFVFGDLPQVTAYQYFEVIPNGGCPLVADRYLLDSFQGAKIDGDGTPFSGAPGHPFIAQYITDNNLYFVHDEDACWCKTIFAVTKSNTSGVTLEETSGTPVHGCCPTMPVPEPGDVLGRNQNIIPAGYACQYGGPSAKLPVGEVSPFYCPKCAPPDAGGCSTSANDNVEYDFSFDAEAGVWGMSRTARHVEGKLTWPILGEHMDKLFEKIEEILACGANQGLRPDGVTDASSYTGPPDSSEPTLYWDDDADVGDGYESHGGTVVGGWALRGSGCASPPLKAWLASLRFEFEQYSSNTIDPDENGTLVQTATDYSHISSCYAGEFDKPWETLTGNDSPENCPEAGLPKVYCETLNQLSEIIETIETRLWPNGTFNPEFHESPNTDCYQVKYCCKKENAFTRTCNLVSIIEDPICEGGRLVSDCSSECCVDENTCFENDMTWDGCGCSTNNIDVFCCCYAVASNELGDCVYAAECHPLDAEEGYFDGDDCTDQYSGDAVADGASCSVFFGSCEGGFDAGSYDYDTGNCTTGSCSATVQPSDPEDYTYYSLVPKEDCRSCSDDDNPCCLLHTVFNESDDGCLEYIAEINAFISRVTGGEMSCSYPDSSRSSYRGPVNNCTTIECWSMCESTLPTSVETCLNQAGMAWSIENTTFDETPVYYLEITAPAAAP